MSTAVAALGRGLKRVVQVIVGVVVVVALYYAVGGHLVHRIDADPAFAEELVAPAGGSALVATMAELVRREVDQHGWVANDPWIFPSSLLDDMAHYQRALIASSRATVDLLVGRLEAGEAATLEAASTALAAPDDLWPFDLARSFRPQKSTEQYYREAADGLARFNAELAAGTAALAGDRAAVGGIVAAFAATLEAAAAAGLEHVDERGGHWLDTTTDDRFQTTRGLVYARLVFLRALVADHAEMFRGHRDLVEGALRRLERAAGLGPWYVVNGPADGQLRPSHLAAQAAYTLEAGAALGRLADALAAGDT